MKYIIEDDGGTLCVCHEGVRCLIWGLGGEKVGHIVEGIYSDHTSMVTITINYSLPPINILRKRTYS